MRLCSRCSALGAGPIRIPIDPEKSQYGSYEKVEIVYLCLEFTATATLSYSLVRFYVEKILEL